MQYSSLFLPLIMSSSVLLVTTWTMSNLSAFLKCKLSRRKLALLYRLKRSKINTHRHKRFIMRGEMNSGIGFFLSPCLLWWHPCKLNCGCIFVHMVCLLEFLVMDPHKNFALICYKAFLSLQIYLNYVYKFYLNWM